MIDITQRPKQIKLDAYSNMGILGEGGFGTVCLMKSTADGSTIALKKMKKKQIIEQKQVDHIKNEVYILNAVRHPFIVTMAGITQNPKFMMIGMEYVKGNEMFNYLRQINKVALPQAIFYAGQIVLMLEYLHTNKIIYRDLKPENVMIDQDGYLKLTDFGFAKRLEGRTYTFCGTTEYLAPEIILNKGHSYSVDWWALGVLIYEMLVGVDPFNAPDPMVTYDNIVKHKLKIPSSVPGPAKSLVERLLEPDLDKRFGNLLNGFADVKNHAFFDSIKLDELLAKKIAAPYKPKGETKLGTYAQSSELSVPALPPNADPFTDW